MKSIFNDCHSLTRLSLRSTWTTYKLPALWPCWLERSPAKHGRLGLIFSWVIPKTLKIVSAASLALKLRI